jgi:hypothetical protein
VSERERERERQREREREYTHLWSGRNARLLIAFV